MIAKQNRPQLRFHEFDGEWKQKRLGEITKITTGSTPSTLIEEYYNGEKLFVSPADIQGNRYVFNTKTTLTESGFSKGRKIAKGSVLFVCIGSTIGKVAQATEECLTNQQINALDAYKEYENDFIYELLEKNGTKIKLLAGVQAVPQINKTDFSNFKYFFPTLPEQQKIASFLSAVDEKIQQLSRKNELLEQYKKGVMQQLFSGKLRFKPARPAGGDENGEEYPDWEEKKLGDVCEIVGGGTPDTNIPEYWGGEIQWFTPTEIKSDFVSNSIRTITELGLQKSSAKKLPIGTILLTTRATIGEVSIAREECSTNQGFQSLIARKGNSNIFIFNWIKQNKHELTSRANGSTFPEISKTAIEKIFLNAPSFPEQQKIANFLSSIDAKIESTSQQINQMQSFKKGLLQQMFV